MFTTQFDNYVCENDSIDCVVNGIRYTARVQHDPDCSPRDYDAPGCCFDTSSDEYGEENQKIIDAWDNDEWFYVVVVVSACIDESGHELGDYLACLGGVDCNFPGGDNNYLMDVANELLDEAKEEANKELESLRESLASL